MPAERGPRPAPDQPNKANLPPTTLALELVDGMAKKVTRISELIERKPLFERYNMPDVVAKLRKVERGLDKLIRRELRRQAQEFVVFEAPKTPEKKAKPKKRKERKQEKSRGLKDKRPVEFQLPSGRELRGKSGKIVKILFTSKDRSSTAKRMAPTVLPGIPERKAVGMVNERARHAKRLIKGDGWNITVERDNKNDDTKYTLLTKTPKKKK